MFAERYDGRDSECVMRRAVRAMWESVRRSGQVKDRGAKQSSQYSLLYSVMLSYIAWIVPCPEDMEQAMRATHDPRRGRRQFLVSLNRAIRDLALGVTDDDDAVEPVTVKSLVDSGMNKSVAQAAINYSAAESMFREGSTFEGIDPSKLYEKELLATEASIVFTPGVSVATKDDPAPVKLTVSEDKSERDKKGRRRIHFTANGHRATRQIVAAPQRIMPTPLKMIAAMTVVA